MKLSLRHFAAAPLLIPALAIAYDLVESLRDGPCPGQCPGWIVGVLITAAFALYFFAGYWMIVARKYVVMAILTLWGWHLLMLSPFLAAGCPERRGLDEFSRVVGFGFWNFAIAIALVAIASSFALYLRYRMPNGSPAAERRAFLRLSVAGATVVSVALAAAAYWSVPLLLEAYSTFGADLPAQTLVLFATYQYWMILPLACIAGLLYVNIRARYSERQLQIALDGATGLIVLLNVAASTFLFSAALPVKKLCGWMCRCL